MMVSTPCIHCPYICRCMTTYKIPMTTHLIYPELDQRRCRRYNRKLKVFCGDRCMCVQVCLFFARLLGPSITLHAVCAVLYAGRFRFVKALEKFFITPGEGEKYMNPRHWANQIKLISWRHCNVIFALTCFVSLIYCTYELSLLRVESRCAAMSRPLLRLLYGDIGFVYPACL